MKLEYVRKHLPSGNTDKLTFNASHGVVFADEGVNAKALVKQAWVCIEQWNASQPSTWKYWLVEPAPDTRHEPVAPVRTEKQRADFERECRIQACYLTAGLDSEFRKANHDLLPAGGYMDLIDLCADMSVVVAEFLESPEVLPLEFPGVFNYEVTEELGAWLLENHHCNRDQFVAELKREFQVFMNQGTPANEQPAQATTAAGN